jgi:hypothetical protein
MTEFDRDYIWSNKFIPNIADKLGRSLITPAPFEDDTKKNTDLIVLKLDAVRIGCRIRRHSYLTEYPNEFTIRTSRPTGARTEMSKIIEGWGNYFFYGFSNENETEIEKWTLADLNVFRLWFNSFIAKHEGRQPGKHKYNDNGYTFRAFKWSDLPESFIVDSSDKRSAS